MASKYGSMYLSDLKAELKRRNAKTSGRKTELIDRLEAYDRNSNFGQDCETQSEFFMDLPEATAYKDLHADQKLSPLSFDLAYEYLEPFNVEFDSDAVDLYKEKFLRYIRLCSTDEIDFVKCACRASMKKKVIYLVDVSFKKSGKVHEAQCECGAGEGPHGHCKHIRAVLYACCKFIKSGVVNVELSCTEKLQTFHKAKRHVGSPIKAENLKMPGADEVCNFDSYDVRPQEYRNTDWYQSHFYNTCMNHPGISDMPIFQIFTAANVRGVANDHDYLINTPEDQFLRSLNLYEISNEDRLTLEFCTRGQSSNARWFEEREKRLQSSNFGAICRATERANMEKLATSMITASRFKKNKAIVHGQTFEKEAIHKYESDHGVKVQNCGIFVSKTHPFIGASPDGVISEDLICEVKCPFTAKNKQITSVTVPYLKEENGELSLSRIHPYFYQIQGQLFCSERKSCDLVIYTIKDVAYIRIHRDEKFIISMLGKLQSFFEKYFKPALLDKLFYKPL